jgi:ferric-dicitrate binding protein FerR (iron transport regulator)
LLAADHNPRVRQKRRIVIRRERGKISVQATQKARRPFVVKTAGLCYDSAGGEYLLTIWM